MILTVTSNIVPIFVFPRIHPFALKKSSSRGDVYSRHEPGRSNFASSASSVVTKYCPRTTVFMKPAPEHTLIIRRSSGRFSNLCLYSRSRFLHARSLVRSGLVVVDKSVGETIVSGLTSATGFTVLTGLSDVREANLSHRSATAPINTGLIDGNNSAQKHFNSLWVTTEVYRQFSTYFASQSSLFQSTCSTVKGMSTFTEVEQHVFSDMFPFSIRLVRD